MSATKGMRAQVSLIPNEAKRLIAKAVVRMPEVKAALKRGKIIIKEGTTTSPVAEELANMPVGISGRVSVNGTMGAKAVTAKYRILIDKGEVTTRPITNDPLHEIFSQLGADDVIITGANALDAQKRAGMMVGGVTLSPGFLLPAFRAQGVTIIIVVGWEKLIPNSIEEAAIIASRKGTNVSMGMAVGIVPITGIVVTETDAISMLADVKTTVIGAGGIMGAEGSTTFIVEGEPAEVKKAWDIITEIKGATISGQPETFDDCEPQGELCKGFIIEDGVEVPKHKPCIYREKDSLEKLFSQAK